MSFLEARRKAAQQERRRSARFTIDIPVILRTISGDRECRMANISDNGAKLETDTPPREGVSGWLIMGGEEIYCTVIWSKEGACGIEFERSLSEDKLVEIAGEQVTETVPVANRGNIQMGRKRGSLLKKGVAKKPEPQSEPQAQTQAQTQVEPAPEPEPQKLPELQSEPETQARPELQPEPKPIPEPKPRIDNPLFMSKRQAISAS